MKDHKRLGDYIRAVDVRNRELKITKPMGINIDKYFMPSVANVIGTDLSNYKLVSKRQFACNLMHVGRDEKIPMALLTTDETIIVSPAYFVFEVANPNILLPEYLMMWFSRKEFDRNAWFYTDADVRGGMDKDALLDMKLPIPSIEWQRKIVAEYETLSRRIAINKQLITRLEATAQALYRKIFVDGIDKENLPEGWRMGTLGEVSKYVDEKISLSDISESVYISTENMLKDKMGIVFSINKPNEGRGTKFQIDDVLISNIRPYFKKIWRASFCGASSNDVLCFRAEDSFNSSMLYYTIEQDSFFDYVMAGSNGVKMPRGDKEWIMKYPIIIPSKNDVEEYQETTKCIRKQCVCYNQENEKLTELQSLLLAKMGR